MVVVLFNAGLQEPLIPLSEVSGNAFKISPEQIGATLVKVGVILGITVIVNVAVFAH